MFLLELKLKGSCESFQSDLTSRFDLCSELFSFSSSPKSSILGHVANTGLYCDVDEYEEVNVWEEEPALCEGRKNIHTDQNCCLCSQAAEYEGIKIFHSNSSIYFANSDLYVNSLKEKVALCLYVSRDKQKPLLWGKYVKHLLSLGLNWLSLRGAAWACNYLVVDVSRALLWDEQEVRLLVI